MTEWRAAEAARLRLALGVGAGVWLFLLSAGLMAPGGWVWTLEAVLGATTWYAVALWLITLVLAPLLACHDPLRHRTAVDLYVLGMLAVMVSTFLARLRGELPTPVGGGVPIAASLSSALVLWAYLAGRRRS